MPDITIDKSSLVYDDNEFEYKTRVPGTFGEDIRYLWINNPQALKKQADTIVSSTAKVIFEENYLKNAEMSIEDDYDSIDGIINNGNKQQEYEKLKEPDKKSERRTAPLSRNQIKQNANTIAHNEQRTNDKTKTQGQEL